MLKKILGYFKRCFWKQIFHLFSWPKSPLRAVNNVILVLFVYFVNFLYSRKRKLSSSRLTFLNNYIKLKSPDYRGIHVKAVLYSFHVNIGWNRCHWRVRCYTGCPTQCERVLGNYLNMNQCPKYNHIWPVMISHT